ncbi:MAG: TetR/AcrR family transcriptional regulator [Pseudomonadales bacterium]
MKRTRGRPKQYDESSVIQAAAFVFWSKGFSATSLDDLSAAMGMTRPSIYNAFGNKNDIYRKALSSYCGQIDNGLDKVFNDSLALHPALISFFNQAIDVYCGSQPAMGCLMVCTAPSEALSHPDVGEDLKSLIHRLDRRFCERLEKAQDEGVLSKKACPKLSAKLLQATLQTLALRARAGESKSSLRKLARYAVITIAGEGQDLDRTHAVAH